MHASLYYDPAELQCYIDRFHESSLPQNHLTDLEGDADRFSLGDDDGSSTSDDPFTKITKESTKGSFDGFPKKATKESTKGCLDDFPPKATKESAKGSSDDFHSKSTKESTIVSSDGNNSAPRVALPAAPVLVKSSASSVPGKPPSTSLPKALATARTSSQGSIASKGFVAGSSTSLKQVMCNDLDASNIEVRVGPGYAKNKKKAPSGKSIYEFCGMDVLRGKHRVTSVASHVQIPWGEEVAALANEKGLPKIIIVNLILPNKGMQMFRTEADPGTSIVFYFKLRQDLPPISDPGMQLACKFFAGKLEGRFKALAFIDNMNELRMPSMLMGAMNKMNGKPILVHKTGIFVNMPSLSEIGVDVFNFPTMARTMLSAFKTSSHHAKLRVAFVLQGEMDSELPERVLGCCEVRNLDIEACVFDRFN